MINGDFTVTAIILNWEQRCNIPRIVTKLQLISPNIDIWIWNNNPMTYIKNTGILKKCVIFNSSQNFFCPVRHAIAMLVYSKYILFIDDDILPTKDLFLALQEFVKFNNFSIIGAMGVRVNKERPYINPIHKCHSELYDIIEPTPVDYVKGRMMFVRTELMHHLWKYKSNMSIDEIKEDDISLNFALQMESGMRSYILPGNLFENLPGWDEGLHSDWATFSAKRDRTISAFKKLGWSSLLGDFIANSSNFPECNRK